jgi:hypothetical protein
MPNSAPTGEGTLITGLLNLSEGQNTKNIRKKFYTRIKKEEKLKRT